MLEVDGIDARYGHAQVLFGMSFRIGPAEAVALLGRNGAGKSTLLKSIMGLVPATGGQIRFAGQRIDGMRPSRVCRLGLGYVPEDRRIFTDLTVLENLEVGRRPALAGGEPWTAERIFQLFPSLGEMRHRRGDRMSGGEQQMLTIARTLMGNPTLLLLDEPSEGLAPRVVEILGESLASLRAANLALLIAEPNLAFAARLADRAILIEKGRVAHEGAIADLVRDEEIQRAYLGA